MGYLEITKEVSRHWSWRKHTYPWYKSLQHWGYVRYYLLRPVLLLSEELSVFLFQLAVSPVFVMAALLSLFAGCFGALTFELRSFAEISIQIIIGLLAIAITGVIFIATLTDQRTAAQKMRELRRKNLVRRYRTVIGRLVKKYARLQGEEVQWGIYSVLQLYIYSHIDGQEDVPKLKEVLNEIKIRFKDVYWFDELNNLTGLVQQSYISAEYNLIPAVQALLSLPENICTVFEREQLEDLKYSLEANTEYTSTFSLMSLLGPRIIRVLAYSLISLVALATIYSSKFGVIKMYIGGGLSVELAIEVLIISIVFGTFLLLIRYLVLLLKFVQTEMIQTSATHPYVYDPDDPSPDYAISKGQAVG